MPFSDSKYPASGPQPGSREIVILLAGLMALNAFAIDAMIPALPAIGDELNGLIKEWMATRDATIALVRGLPDDAWTRRGVANGKTVTALAIAYIILGHVEHHLGVLRDRYGV